MNSVLILNVGSSSVKYSILSENEVLFDGVIERIKDKKGYQGAVKKIFGVVKKNKINVSAIGHRVVHGGLLKKSKGIDEKLISYLKKIKELAPLHQIPEIHVIESCRKLFPKTKQIAVFDTAFHETMPEKAFLYGIPYKYYIKDKIRRYGFHGISHKCVSESAAKIMKNKHAKIISCHLGNGCSITAIKDGKSIDTSMGFTPLEGPIMGTRSGSIDPSIIPYLVEKEKLSIKEIKSLLNHKSGLLGISGVSNDFRDLLKARRKNKRAKLALDVFYYQLSKYIGSYIAALNGVDAIVFTAGIGENSAVLRTKVLENFKFIGVDLEEKKNRNNETVISSKKSKVKIFVIKTDEMKVIYEEMRKVLGK